MADLDPLAQARQVENTNRGVLELGSESLTNSAGAFNVYRYPEDLAKDHHPHYMMFFITVRKSDASGVELATGSDGKQINFDYSQNNTIAKSSAAAGTYGVISGGFGGTRAGGQLGKGIAELVTDPDSAAGKRAAQAITTTGKVIGGIGGAAALGGTGFLGDREQVLLKDAIALYINKNPSVSYAAGWADEDLGIIAGASEQLKGTSGIMDAGKKLAQGAGGAASAYILKSASTDFAGLGNAGGAFSASAGIAVNPFKAQLFKSMGFREFTYEYIFLPRNVQEYTEAKNIIKTFKKYMHPTLGAEKFLMGYPAEFTIAYYYKDNVSDELFRISNCALINMSVEYGGSDFATFKDTGNLKGAPSEIALKLTFKELELLSQERIDVGF